MSKGDQDKDKEQDPSPKGSEQTDLGGGTVPPIDHVLAYLEVKHNKRDEVTDKRQFTLTGSFHGKQGRVGNVVNLNFNDVAPGEYKDLLQVLGIKNLTKGTPLVAKIWKPQGSTLDDWQENFKEPEEE